MTPSPLAAAAFEYAPEDAKLRDAFYAGVRWAETSAPEANARDAAIEECADLCLSYAQISDGEADAANAAGMDDTAEWERAEAEAAKNLAKNIRALKGEQPLPQSGEQPK